MKQKINLLNRRGQNIVGRLSIPEREQLTGTAIIQHGHSGNKDQKHILVLEQVLLDYGFQVVNFDASNSFGESDGELKNARLGLHADDFEDVASWTQEQDWFSGPLLVSGHSMGGFAAARYALRNSDLVDFVIPFAPVVSGELLWAAKRKFYPEQFQEWQESGVQYRTSKSVKGMVKEIPWEIMIEYLEHSLLTENNQNPKMLLIACEHDTSIPPNHVEIFYDTLLGEKNFQCILGSGHTLREQNHLDSLRDLLVRWFRKNISS